MFLLLYSARMNLVFMYFDLESGSLGLKFSSPMVS